jgi:hypothetical protein
MAGLVPAIHGFAEAAITASRMATVLEPAPVK